MKPLIITLAFIFTLPCSIYTQKNDFNWLFGNTYTNATGICEVGVGTNHIDFGKDSLVINCLKESHIFRPDGSMASISDDEGNLLFYSDNMDIYNARHEIMKGGDSISICAEYDFYYTHTRGKPTAQCLIILPYPGQEDRYIIVHQAPNRRLNSGSFTRVEETLYSIIDMSGDNGLGEVIKKNEVLIEERFAACKLRAVRHANGRDWWIPIPLEGAPFFYVFLLDPEGIHLHHIDTIHRPVQLLLPFNFKPSPQGDMFVLVIDETRTWGPPHPTYPVTIQSISFDRCSGKLELSNEFRIDASNLYKLIFVEFDPNGRFIYLPHVKYIYQIDIRDPDPLSTLDTVAVHSEDPDLFIRSSFLKIGLTPKGQIIVISSGGYQHTLIANPELKGKSSNVLQHTLISPKLVNELPYFPNFRLGPIDNSPCDTLGINNEPKAWFRYNDINLEYRQRRFTDISYFRPEQWRWDFDDGTTYDSQHPGVHEFPAPGEYYVCLTVSNEYAEDTYCEWVVIDELSSTGEIAADDGFWVFPNPTTGDFTLRLEKPITKGTEIRVYDLLGRELHRHPLPAGSSETLLSLGQLPSGKYILQLFDGERVRTGSVFRIDN